MFKQFLLLVFLASFLVSCAGLERLGVKTTSKIIYAASYDMETESNWENFKNSVLPNLKMAEGMLSLEPENLDLLATLTKGYAGYALAVNETLLMDDVYSGKLESFEQEQAISNYSKALEFGLRYLKVQGMTYEGLSRLVNQDGEIAKVLSKNLSSENLRDQEVVLYSALSLSSLVNLQKNKSYLVAQIPVGKQMMDWVCEHNPSISFGTCGLFYGSFESSRPKTLGGNPQKGKEHFLKVIQDFPQNDLARVFYIQYYLVPQLEEGLFKDQMKLLQEAQVQFNESWRWNPQSAVLTVEQKRLRLYQAIAMKRFQIIKKYEKEIF